MIVTPIDFAEANAFVSAHHRHHKPMPKGFKRFGANGIERTHDDSAQREIARQVAYGEVTATTREPGCDC